MAANESLTNRVRELRENQPHVEEKKMFRGITFMVNDKMCVSVSNDELMCRIDPAIWESLLEENGCRPMMHSSRIMKGFIYVHMDVLKTTNALQYWVHLCLDYNSSAKAAPKKKTTASRRKK